MFKLKHAMLCAFPLLMATPSLRAQEQQNIFSLKDCLNIGLKNNYDVQIVRINQEIASNNATRANAGQLPTVNAQVGYTGNLTSTTNKQGDIKTSNHNVPAHALNARLVADWTIFDGFKLQANYQKLKALKQQSELTTRIALEDYVANAATAYYNIIRQQMTMNNLKASLALSRTRLRIVNERYLLGSASRLDLRSAQVDFNADSTQVLLQHEALINAVLDLQQLMGRAAQYEDGKGFYIIHPADTTIKLMPPLDINAIEQSMLKNHAQILKAQTETQISELDRKAVLSRDYPYLKLSANYDYNHTLQKTEPTQRRNTYGPEVGLTLGMKLFDGDRTRQRKNADAEIRKSQTAQQEVELTLRTQLERLWKSYKNNQQLLSLAQQNLKVAAEHHEAAQERFMLGTYSGIEMRQAEQNLLDARERLLQTQFNTKICEISLLNISGNVIKLTQ
jgi:outer membrane protein TolC